MKDLSLNIEKAIETLNRTNKLQLSLTTESADVLLTSSAETENIAEEDLKLMAVEVAIYAEDLYMEFRCMFEYQNLLKDASDPEYLEAMKKIITDIYNGYMDAKNYFKSVITGSQTISVSGSKTLNNTWANISLSAPTKSDLYVSGEIKADDIKINGGQLSVSSELDDLKKQNKALEAELDVLKGLLKQRGII